MQEETPPLKAPAETSFERFAEESFLAVYARVNNKPSELASKKAILKHHLIPVFGARPLSSITVRDFEEYKAQKLSKGLSPKSINNQLAVLSRLLHLAEEWQLIERAPRVKLLRVPDPDFDFLDFEESERLLAAAESAWRAPILFCLRTGVRQGELRALRGQDIQLRSRRALIRKAAWNDTLGVPKGGKSREIALASDVLELFQSRPARKDAVVFAHVSGRMWTRNEMKWPLWRACARADLRRIGWHVLRHTFASQLAMRGVPLKVIQELLGHADIRTTMRYAHLAPAVRHDAVECLLPKPSKGIMLPSKNDD